MNVPGIQTARTASFNSERRSVLFARSHGDSLQLPTGDSSDSDSERAASGGD
jgi:hypothetical protein